MSNDYHNKHPKKQSFHQQLYLTKCPCDKWGKMRKYTYMLQQTENGDAKENPENIKRNKNKLWNLSQKSQMTFV